MRINPKTDAFCPRSVNISVTSCTTLTQSLFRRFLTEGHLSKCRYSFFSFFFTFLLWYHIFFKNKIKVSRHVYTKARHSWFFVTFHQYASSPTPTTKLHNHYLRARILLFTFNLLVKRGNEWLWPLLLSPTTIPLPTLPSTGIDVEWAKRKREAQGE